MKSILSALCAIVFLISCNRDAELNQPTYTDVQYVIKGETFNLQDDELKDEFKSTTTFNRASSLLDQESLQSFDVDRLPNMMFFFEDDISFYRYFRRYHDEASRRFILLATIDELIDSGFKDIGVINSELEAVKEELSISNPVEELASLLQTSHTDALVEGVKLRQNVLLLHENLNFGSSGGAVMCYEDEALHTTYGTYGCYTKSTIADLTTVPKSTGGKWNNVISSLCSRMVQGADAMSFSFYKKKNWDYSGHCNESHTRLDFDTGMNCGNLNSGTGARWSGRSWCGFIEDEYSSIWLKAVWQGCTITFTDVPRGP